MDDEKAILATVQAVSAARTIDDTRVFLTGWSGGSYAVLFTGLRHTDIFRAIAVRQGTFNEHFVEPTVPFLDPHQPVLLMYGNIDSLKDDTKKAINWMQDQGMQPRRLERVGAHRRDPEPVYSFFADVVRNQPWIRIVVEDDPDNAMKVRLSVKSSFEAGHYLWDFGDNERSVEARPTHTYARPSSYTVKVAVYTANERVYVRQIELPIPRIRLGAVAQILPTTQPTTEPTKY
jgi:hypothetical protein